MTDLTGKCEFLLLILHINLLSVLNTYLMKNFYKSTRSKSVSFFLVSLLGIMFTFSTAAFASGNVTLFTPYTKISVPPGKMINYNITVINNSDAVQNLNVFISGMPRGWNYNLKSGGWVIKQISILPKKKEILTLSVEVPLKINKGTYQYKVMAGSNYSLPLTVVVSKRGTYKTVFTAKQANMEGHANSTFSFNTELDNLTADQQLYSLRSEVSRGWDVTFRANYKEATSVSIKPNSKSAITISVKPPDRIQAGTYKIPIEAVTNNTSASLKLDVVITGTYKMELTTPTGLVSTSVTAGHQKRLELIVRNTGSAVLNNVKPGFRAPSNWDVTFDPKEINTIEPGQSAQVFATLKADRKAIAGDYITKISTKTPEVSSNLTFRVSVKTPMLWGWIGVLIIIVALGLVYYLFRKYGRR